MEWALSYSTWKYLKKDSPVYYSGDKCKSKVAAFYNCTEDGVDAIAKICNVHSVARNACQWPVAMCYSMLNILQQMHILDIYETALDQGDNFLELLHEHLFKNSLNDVLLPWFLEILNGRSQQWQERFRKIFNTWEKKEMPAMHAEGQKNSVFLQELHATISCTSCFLRDEDSE
jgi:hypothetical protein